jgi:formate C-acetyltransferase
LIEAYFAQGGQHLQINIVSADTLRAAQQDPEAYRELVVRVTGYSAYFVTLDQQSQDRLIAGATNCLGR